MPETKDQWKVWVEKATHKLHVHGEIYVSDPSLVYELDKQDPQGYFKDELMLVIKPKLVSGAEKVEVKYHEVLQQDTQYKKITIGSDNQQVAQVTDITVK